MAKGRRARTKDLYNKILGAYRVAGDNHAKASRLSGVSREACTTAFEVGWPSVPGGIPIREQLLQDQIILRASRVGADPQELVANTAQVLAGQLEGAREGAKDAVEMLQKAASSAQAMEAKAKAALDEAIRRLSEVEDLARSKVDAAELAAKATMARAELDAKARLAELLQKAKVDAAETMADEANAAKFGRKAALSAAAIAALVLKDAAGIAAAIRTALGDLSKLSPMQAVRLAREMVRLVESSEKAIILALQAERLRVGQPTEVIGIQGYDTSIEEKEIKVRAVARALERARVKRNGLALAPVIQLEPKKETVQ